ncbi:hypothetical protein ACQP3F_30230, partial [Escherichia coli]
HPFGKAGRLTGEQLEWKGHLGKALLVGKGIVIQRKLCHCNKAHGLHNRLKHAGFLFLPLGRVFLPP